MFCDLGCWDVLPFGQPTLLDIFQDAAVRQDGFLFQYSDKSVCDTGREEVEDEEEVVEDALGEQRECSSDGSWLGEVHESQEMHPFVLGILEQSVDPSFVSLHQAERLQVSTGCGYHSWHTSDGFQEDDSVEPRIRAKAKPLGSHLGESHSLLVPILDLGKLVDVGFSGVNHSALSGGRVGLLLLEPVHLLGKV